MMKNYLSKLKLVSLLGVMVTSVWWNVASAQNCAITSPTEGCQGVPIGFTASGAQPGETVTWSTTTGQTATGGTAQFTFASPGPVTITVTVTTPGGSSCTKDLVFTVNAKPTAAFTRMSQKYQCYSTNYYVFQDNSTPGAGRTLVTAEFLFGDGQQDFTTGPGGQFKHGYPDVSGGYYTPFLRVFNDKGCVADVTLFQNVYVTPDIGADFTATTSLSCGTTTVPITNTSAVPYNRVKKFYWDFGDGTTYVSGKGAGLDSCYWSPTHIYSDHGCFQVSLIVQDDSNCWDTMIKPNFACNVNPVLKIEETNGKDAQCQTGNKFSFTHNIAKLNWPTTFLWVFDDPDTGPQNFDNQNFTDAPHVFSKPDVYTVTIQGTMAGCPFFSSIDVLTKGPAAAIDSKGVPDIIADSLRHQCQIKDTVYFKNNSSFAFNDVYSLDDRFGVGMLKQDSMVLVKATGSVRAFEKVIDIYIWGKDTMAVIEKPLAVAAHNALIMHELKMFDNFFGAWGEQRQDDHVTTVWDFGDQTAPQCTTWTKYMLNVWDSNGKWINCNYSRDPKPKHWYTPGKEGCFTVKLTLLDTTYQVQGQGYNYFDVWAFHTDSNRYEFKGSIIDTVLYNQYNRDSLWDPNKVIYRHGGVFNDTARFAEYMSLDSLFDYPPQFDANGDTVFVYNPYCAAEKISYKRNLDPTKKFFSEFDTSFAKWYINPNHLTGDDCLSESTVLLALEPPNASGMKVKPAKGVFCLGKNPAYGVNFDWSETKPACTRQHVWMNFDSLTDRMDNTPAVLDNWTPQAGFLLTPIIPWPLGTLSMPQYPNQIYYDYTGRHADSCGRITVGLRVQNGVDPFTKQPCVDEKWYHHMLKYQTSEPEFTVDTVFGCSPLEVEITFVNEYMDSVDVMIIKAAVQLSLDGNFNKGFSYTDSVFRDVFDPRTGTNINYILTYYEEKSGTPTKIDSFTWVAGEGGLEGCGSELKIRKKRKMVFRDPARFALSATTFTKDGCSNSSEPHYLVVGFDKQIEQDKYLICQNEFIEFKDETHYLLLEPPPSGASEFEPYNYWRRAQIGVPPNVTFSNNHNFNPDGSIRNPKPAYLETIRWDFGQGQGFTPLAIDPKNIQFFVPGHFVVQAEFMDSTGCKDTLKTYVDVTGGKANFNFTVNIGNCKPIINFYDSSRVYDPCRLLYSTGCDSVIRWIWDFGDGSAIVNTTSDNPVSPPIINPSHVYQRFGDYDVTLVIETRMGCFDTLVRTVSVAGPQPRFDFTIDSMGCVPYTVYLANFTLDPTNQSSWTWHFGDNNSITTSSDTVIYHTYTTPGVYKLILEQNDIVPLTGEKCSDSFPGPPRSIEVTVLPEKKVDFIPSKLEVCPNEIITFTDTSDTTYTTFIWDMGDGTIITLDKNQGGRQITHKYAGAGDYVVRLTPDYTPAPGEPKCKQWKSYLIKVRDVNANFTVDTTGMPLFKFTNTSTNFKDAWWRFGDGDDFTKCPQVDPVNCPNAQHNYGDNVGYYDVCLVVLSPEGCYDTACATIRNTFEVSIDIPNVFTPDGDGFNDVFKIDIENWTKYEIKIYNRFSEKVFQSTDATNSWNGKKNNTGADLPAGVYYVVITYQLRGQPEKTYNGTVTLIRP